VGNTARSGNVSSLNGGRRLIVRLEEVRRRCHSSKSPRWEINGSTRTIDSDSQISDREGAHRIPLAELKNFGATIPISAGLNDSQATTAYSACASRFELWIDGLGITAILTGAKMKGRVAPALMGGAGRRMPSSMQFRLFLEVRSIPLRAGSF
jgi:hypothetical protein